MNLLRLSFLVLLSVLVQTAAAQSADHSRAREWEKEISSLLEIDQKQTPPSNAVLFTGSSSIRMWHTLRQDFPGLPVINRGFGGSQLQDLVYFAPRIVAPYRPRKIVVYSGENDIEAGRSPEDVLASFRALIDFRDRDLNGVPIIYIAMKPSVLRWTKWPAMKKGNELIRAESARHRRVTFVDISAAMLGPDGKPDPALFLADGLHMNDKGYKIWRDALVPLLK